MTAKLLDRYEMSCSDKLRNIDSNYIVVVWGRDYVVQDFALKTGLKYSGKYDNSCAGAYEIIFKFNTYKEACDLLNFATRYETRGRIEMEFYDAVRAVEEEE